MTATKSMIHDEARRRMAIVHGSHYGADLTQKALNSLILHVVAPSTQSLHRLHYHLAVLTASNQLEASLPDDFGADHHWPIPPEPETLPETQPLSLPTGIEDLRQEVGALRRDFEEHGHIPEPINGETIEWSDFALRKEVERMIASIKG